MTSSECKKIFATSKYITDPVVEKAKSYMFKKVRLLLLMSFITLIFIYFIISFAVKLKSSINLFTDTKLKIDKYQVNSNGKYAISNKAYDDEDYNKDDNIVLVDEYKEFQQYINKISDTYQDFNQKVTEYQRSQNKDVTDIIDYTILLRDHDDY